MSGTAEIHRATLSPNKSEVLAAWLPSQEWFSAGSDAPEVVDSFRFVDPEGQVGIETFLVRSGDTIFHVPVTYRDAPLEGAEDWLISEMEHSTLGHRWVYDATGDPVYQVELTRVIREGDTEAELSMEGKPLPTKATALGSWVDPTAESSGMLRIARNIEGFSTARARGILTVQFHVDGTEREAVVAALR